jgi:hypothetical protein
MRISADRILRCGFAIAVAETHTLPFGARFIAALFIAASRPPK